tara:strand:+ start:3357 stop:4880 length:1524 start_codon:yes stop_codon:yes gene_type:complete
MTGGLLQLKYIGADGNKFVGNPQISFFKSVFKSYGNFSSEMVNVFFIKTPSFNSFTQCKVPINGDLINKIYLSVGLKINVNSFFNLTKFEGLAGTTGTSSINRKDISNTSFIGGQGFLYEYDKKLNNNYNYLYNYKYKLDESLFNSGGVTNKIDKNSLIISEININNTFSNLFNLSDNILNLMNVTTEKLYVLFLSNGQYYNAIVYIKYIKEDFTKFIKNVSFEIDEYIIDKHDTKWLLAYNNYFNNDTSNIITNELKYITPEMFNQSIKLYIPLRFYFTQHTTNSLPISALYHSSCMIKLYTNKENDSFSFINEILNTCEIEHCNLNINYIHLDKDEKKYFISNPQELLIEQVQHQQNLVTNNLETNIELTFTYLCKYLIWNIPYNYYLEKAKIVFNNQDLCEELDGEYFHLLQPLEYDLGNSESFSRMEYNKNRNGTYYLYSFSLNPKQNQPSGLCNMSRIDDKNLKVLIKDINNSSNNNDIDIDLYCVNYNFLIIKGGKCKLMF